MNFLLRGKKFKNMRKKNMRKKIPLRRK